MLEDKQTWYTEAQFALKPEEEEKYFEEVNQLIFLLHTLELRLKRHRELCSLRYHALKFYLFTDARLQIPSQRQEVEDETVRYSML